MDHVFVYLTNSLFSEISYNQPKFCASATWNSNAITFATNATVGENPQALFVDASNTIYIANGKEGSLLLWTQQSRNVTQNISIGLLDLTSLFVLNNGDVYIAGGLSSYEIRKWSPHSMNNTTVMHVPTQCYGLFVDTNYSLYFSMRSSHHIVKTSLNISNDTRKIVAGNGSEGSTSTMLSKPYGIFINTDFDLYVADYGNDRIQLFRSGHFDGKTIVGENATYSVPLYHPSSIVFDANQNLFIVDSDNHRIIRTGPDGFLCIGGCSQNLGSASNELHDPRTLSFDSYGNIFVADWINNRIQKFVLTTNVCSKYKVFN